jgi:AraC family transcriptional regulator
MAIDAYLNKNKLNIAGAPWEVYVTDPGVEPDSSKWYTQVIYPIQ